MSDEVITVERVIPAPPEAIFDFLADASKHPLIDGSGTLKQHTSGSPQRLSLGAKFGMSMKLGVPYRVVNTVVEFEDNRLIAWSPHLPGMLAKITGGRIWRYELEPVEGGTRVRETWDISKDKQKIVMRRGAASTGTSMEKSLAQLEQLVSS
jgi:uncharacterized protein YndB with AHSA1/START domain